MDYLHYIKCSSYFSACCDKMLTKSSLGEGRFIWLLPTDHSPSRGKPRQDKNLEAKIEVETMEGGRLFTVCSLWLVQPPFLSSPCPAVQGWHHLQWPRPSTPIVSQESAPQSLPTSQFGEGIFSVKFSSS